MTIRKAILKYKKKKATSLGCTMKFIENHTSLCLLIPLNNGVRLFINYPPHTKVCFWWMKHPKEIPTKKYFLVGISFHILANTNNLKIPEYMNKYLKESRMQLRDSLYYVHSAKERDVNRFIRANGGINEIEFNERLDNVWNSCDSWIPWLRN